MLLPVRDDLIGWSDEKTGERYTLGQAEAKFGAAIYRTGQRPEGLVPVFRSVGPSRTPDFENRAKYNLGNGCRWTQRKVHD